MHDLTVLIVPHAHERDATETEIAKGRHTSGFDAMSKPGRVTAAFDAEAGCAARGRCDRSVPSSLMRWSWLSFSLRDAPEPATLTTALPLDDVVERLGRDVRKRQPWSLDLVARVVGEVGDRSFRIQLGGLSRNAYSPVLAGVIRSAPQGTEIRLSFERPGLLAAKVIRLAVVTILPIVFLVGFIGVLAGGHSDQGGSLLPFLIGPIAMGTFYVVFDHALRWQAEGYERQLVSFVTGRLS